MSANVLLFITIFTCIVALALYFLPFLVANGRGHPQVVAIFALNLLLGWTLLGWIAAFVWSLTAFERRS
ncbi:MAG: superinfection immunity protein [Pseudohongiellaceae bacterium]